ncbi:uncharacterized protein [Chanodichthys erythropterus]|uniref:uncharacterized protein isoform X4 n=1 Tax=Chanodichthys erythropterus TaxID=933992 RepID=UPI00351E90B9
MAGGTQTSGLAALLGDGGPALVLYSARPSPECSGKRIQQKNSRKQDTSLIYYPAETLGAQISSGGHRMTLYLKPNIVSLWRHITIRTEELK